MSPIIYIEARCDECNDEIYSGLGVDFALLRNGKLVCTECRNKRPDIEWFKNFSIPKMPEPEEETPEPDAIDRAKEEQLDRKC